ncbi:hypothetical protein BDV98DRAFT_563483 [Pterulicium gracile]|uniref:Ser-Thr-rich glycosyl-phosphatidyl-inositol-anchored membrane family-domain-containing protein n=1 Tax=Pterulicium gracile TaxID=1884261 RepID=A0A5C3QT79_9AGAR|nr:hypothetical protein BDV98DRAFT_563483 [Pterula gracilis]
MVFAASVALLAFATAAFAQGDFVINTPTAGVVTCQPLRVTWVGGTPPYFVSLRTPTAPINLGQFDGNFLVWEVNQPANTQIGFDITDSDGQVRQTGDFAATAGSNEECLGKEISISGGVGGGSTPSTSGGAEPTTAADQSSTQPPSDVSSSTNSEQSSAGGNNSTPRPSTPTASPSDDTEEPAESEPADEGAASVARVGVASLVGAVGAVMAFL